MGRTKNKRNLFYFYIFFIDISTKKIQCKFMFSVIHRISFTLIFSYTVKSRIKALGVYYFKATFCGAYNRGWGGGGWLISGEAYNGGNFASEKRTKYITIIHILNNKIHFLRNYNYRSLQNYLHHLQFHFRYQVQIQMLAIRIPRCFQCESTHFRNRPKIKKCHIF